MSHSEFDIIFRGDIVFGHQLAEVKLTLQQLFKVDAAKVDALFTGRPVPLKRKLDEATARKYRDVLLKAGAQVEICPSAAPEVAPRREAPVAPTSKAAPMAATLAPQPVASAASLSATPSWSIAPAGADLIPVEQRPAAPAPVAVDISGLSLRPQAGDLVDASERAAAPVAAVAVPDLGVAEPGARLSDDSLPLAQLDIELDWQLAEPGADLLRPDERPAQPLVAVAPLAVDLAPVGSDLGQLKPQLTPLNPDTRGLQLVDPS